MEKKRMKEGKQTAIVILLAALVAIVAANQLMLLAVSSAPRFVVVQSEVTGTATATQPQSGIPLNEQGYQQLLGFDRTIKLDNGESEKYVGLNVAMPCCGFQTLQAEGNCECGHHVALSGLAKYMIKSGYDREQVQQEIDAWKDIFYPGAGSGSLGGC